MVAATGMGKPRLLINYAGHLLRLTIARAPESDCPYFKGIRGMAKAPMSNAVCGRRFKKTRRLKPSTVRNIAGAARGGKSGRPIVYG